MYLLDIPFTFFHCLFFMTNNIIGHFWEVSKMIQIITSISLEPKPNMLLHCVCVCVRETEIRHTRQRCCFRYVAVFDVLTCYSLDLRCCAAWQNVSNWHLCKSWVKDRLLTFGYWWCAECVWLCDLLDKSFTLNVKICHLLLPFLINHINVFWSDFHSVRTDMRSFQNHHN